jgi:hypothetical protein
MYHVSKSSVFYFINKTIIILLHFFMIKWCLFYRLTHVPFLHHMYVRDSSLLKHKSKIQGYIRYRYCYTPSLYLSYYSVLFNSFLFLFFLHFNVHSVVPSFYIIIRYILPIGLSLYSYSHVHLWRINVTRFWTETHTYTNYSQVIIHLLYLFSIRPHYNKYTIHKVIVTNNLSDHDTYSIEKNDDALDWAPQLLHLKRYT